MKKTFIIEVGDEDGMSEINLALKAPAYKSALWDLAAWIRQLYKYSEQESITVEELKEKFWEIMRDADIDPMSDD
jgi:hypothetical protein